LKRRGKKARDEISRTEDIEIRLYLDYISRRGKTRKDGRDVTCNEDEPRFHVLSAVLLLQPASVSHQVLKNLRRETRMICYVQAQAAARLLLFRRCDYRIIVLRRRLPSRENRATLKSRNAPIPRSIFIVGRISRFQSSPAPLSISATITNNRRFRNGISLFISRQSTRLPRRAGA